MKMNEKHIPCDNNGNDYLYRIGLFAQINHITVKTLRFYEEQGILLPAKTDEETGYRYYTMGQMDTLHRILALKEAGFTIEDIKRLETAEDKEALLRRKKNEILAKIAQLTLQLSKMEGYMSEGVASISFPVMIKRLPPVKCAIMESTINSYDELFTLMPQMGEYMYECGCECAVPEYCFTAYLDDGFKEDNIRIQTCQAISAHKKDSDKLMFKVLPETDAACVFHRGSYSSLPETYAAVLRYVETNNYEICGNIRENYIDGIWNKDSEEEWLTEIQVPVKAKGI